MYVCGPTSYREHRTANIVLSGAREEAGQAGWDSVQRNKAGWSSHPTGSDLTLRKDTPRPPLHSILSRVTEYGKDEVICVLPQVITALRSSRRNQLQKPTLLLFEGETEKQETFREHGVLCSAIRGYLVQCIFLEKDTNTTTAEDTGPLVRLIHTAEGLSLGKGSQHDLGKI